MTDVLRRPTPTVQQVFDTDTLAPPAPLREESQRSFGLEDVPVDRYLSREFLDLEVERLWGRVWQWTCREEDIPDAGDYVVYDIVDRSVVILRTEAGDIKGYYNSCLHRGTRLKSDEGNCQTITCIFHSWSWNLDGSIRNVPSRWDFPQKQDLDLTLPEVRLETWAGFVFVNFDDDAAPLSDYLDILPEHFKFFPDMKDRFTAAHVSKVVPGNWKIVLEAFAEAYHTVGTHPQLLGWVADENSQCDVWENTSRLITLAGSPSPHLGGSTDDEETYYGAMEFFAPGMPESDIPQLGKGIQPRAAIAGFARQALGAQLGRDLSEVSDAELLDTLEYFMFPNWMPWVGVGISLQYRFRPNGTDPDTSIMDIRFMAPVPPGGERPPSAPVRRLTLEQPFTDAPELAAMGPILEEDMRNLPLVQKGMKASKTGGLAFSDYQESRIRHFHALLDQWLAD